MHWSEKIAQDIIKRKPDKEEYVCATGISPSGSIHIGNFRDTATCYFVVKALRKMGKKAKLVHSWDEFDRMRKVPANVERVAQGYEKYIGYPLADVPNPFPSGKETYAKHFEDEFVNAIDQFGIDMEYRYQAELYRSGQYAGLIKLALEKRLQIFDILESHRSQASEEGARDAYYPVSIYCPACKRDTTKITSLTDDCAKAEYSCACGHAGTFDFTTDFNCKLAWKVDWPMRWLYEGVDFEPGGKDHASPHGSYDTSKDISKAVFGYDPPIFQAYEFIGIKGSTGKMSGSTGLNLTPATLLNIYQPEVILWLYSKTEPLKAFDFCFDDGILRQYFEFDKMYNAYRDGSANEREAAILYNAVIENREIKTAPMSLLVQLGSIVNFNPEMLEIVFAKIGTPYRYADFRDRLDRAKYWLEQCSPENAIHLRALRNWEHYDGMTEDERKQIDDLFTFLKNESYDLTALETKLYDIPKQYVDAEDKKALKANQGQFFKNVYSLLLGKTQGPRLYLFLYAIEADSYQFLLDFSSPKTPEELQSAAEPVAEEPQAEPLALPLGDPDPVEPLKPAIALEAFEQLDLRVCLVKKCTEIRKSQNCLKLVLDDGLEGRTIVSSIKHDYAPEELIGKKIIVIANLEPKRLAGVKSEGMLLAATNTACGCKVTFVDDSVPVGTAIR